MEDMKQQIARIVHTRFWDDEVNCAVTSLSVLSTMFDVPLDPQVFDAAFGMDGAGRYRAQCGLVEGPIMFIGVVGRRWGLFKDEIEDACFRFAEQFEQEFGSLLCRDLRPDGFREDDPPHKCEDLSVRTNVFTYRFLQKHFFNRPRETG